MIQLMACRLFSARLLHESVLGQLSPNRSTETPFSDIWIKVISNQVNYIWKDRLESVDHFIQTPVF